MEVEVGFKFTVVELLDLQENGQFPDESVKIEDTQIHNGDVLAIVGIKDIGLEGRLL